MSWTNKKPHSKTPPWIYRQTSNRYHDDPIGQISQNYSNPNINLIYFLNGYFGYLSYQYTYGLEISKIRWSLK